jgi:hypothetical protein
VSWFTLERASFDIASVGQQYTGAEMHIDPALLSAISALVGALTGGGASLAAAIYTQRYQDRLQRVDSRGRVNRMTVGVSSLCGAAMSTVAQ